MSHTARRNRGIRNIDGQKIYRHRCDAGWNIQQLATAATTPQTNVSRATVNRAENGHPIGPAKLYAIAAALTHRLGQDIHVNDLLMKEDQP